MIERDLERYRFCAGSLSCSRRLSCGSIATAAESNSLNPSAARDQTQVGVDQLVICCLEWPSAAEALALKSEVRAAAAAIQSLVFPWLYLLQWEVLRAYPVSAIRDMMLKTVVVQQISAYALLVSR